MRKYADFLLKQNKEVVYVNATETISDIRLLLPELKKRGIQEIHFIDPTDNWLQKRLHKGFDLTEIEYKEYSSPLFLNTKEDLALFFKKEKKKYHQTSFYTDQRKNRNILIEPDGKPLGGKWTFDTENRKKYPAKKEPPVVQLLSLIHI